MLKANLQQESSSPLPNDGGRCQYDDGGWYAGNWELGMAHGHGVCGSGPNAREVTEFLGLWQQGFEVNGVCRWSNGTAYEGQWLQGKQHGLGVEAKGHWTYKGEWTHGCRGRYGSCKSLLSNLRYEGSWTSGVKDGYGVEIYPDEGSYHGQWMRGMRHGYGVRQSAPYIVTLRSPLKNHPNSTPSSDLSHIVSFDRDSKMEETRGGFVLQTRTTADDVQKSSKKPGLLDRLGKQGLKIIRQKSAGDLNHGPNFGRPQSGAGSRASSTGGSVRSTTSAFSQISSAFSSSSKKSNDELDEEVGSFCIDEDVANDRVTERYAGEWKNDKRSGFGVCERSDGIKYEGEWLNNRKHGYGVTTLSAGIRLEGKYKNNILVSALKSSKLFSLRSNKIRDKVESSVIAAQKAANMAVQKMETANVRMTSARVRADQADEAAKRAIADAEIASKAAKQYSVELHGTQIIANRQQSNTLSNQIVSHVDNLGRTPNFNQKSSSAQQNQTTEVLKQQKKFTFFKRKGDISWRSKSEIRNPQSSGFSLFGTNPLKPSTSSKSKANDFPSLNTYNQGYESISNSTLSHPTIRSSNPSSSIEQNYNKFIQPLQNSAADSKMLTSLGVPSCPWSDDLNSNCLQSNWIPKSAEDHRLPQYRDSIYNIATSQRNKDLNTNADSPILKQCNGSNEMRSNTDQFNSHVIDSYNITNRNQDVFMNNKQGSYTVESVEANTVMSAWPAKDFQSSNQSQREKHLVNLWNEDKSFIQPQAISTNYNDQLNENTRNDFEPPKDRRKSLPSIVKESSNSADNPINQITQTSSSSPSKMFMGETYLNIFSPRSTAVHPADNIPTDTYIIENGVRKRLKPITAVKVTAAAPKVPHYEVEAQKPSYKRGDMGSLPDVSVISDSEVLPREVVYQLSQRRREELMRQREEMERRYGGNIVLRIEDILEWLWRKKVFIMIFLINVAILCAFLGLLKDK